MKELLLSLSHFTLINLGILFFSLFIGIILIVLLLTATSIKSRSFSLIGLVMTVGMIIFANKQNASQIQQAIENHDYSAKRIGNVLSITSDFKAISNDRLEIFDETTETISVKKENKIFIINKSDLKDN